MCSVGDVRCQDDDDWRTVDVVEQEHQTLACSSVWCSWIIHGLQCSAGIWGKCLAIFWGMFTENIRGFFGGILHGDLSGRIVQMQMSRGTSEEHCDETQDYKCLRIAVIISVTLVNTHTHTHTLTHRQMDSFWLAILLARACLNQLLIMIRSLTTLCNHSPSKTRLIAIMNLVAKLEIIYATLPNHVGLPEYCLSLLPHGTYYYIQTRHGERGKVGSSESLALVVAAAAAARSGSA